MQTQIQAQDTARLIHLLNGLYCPFLDARLGELRAVEQVEMDSAGASIDLRLGAHLASLYPAMIQWLVQQLEGRGFDPIQVRIGVEVKKSAALAHHAKLNTVRNVLLVASGKGGVGKSTTAINLALALSAEGAKVGVLDADIYGPSLPTMLGIAPELRPEMVNATQLQPVYRFGLATMSVAYLMEQTGPVIWRGPMAVKALQQLLEMTAWGALDYLVVDMPPGTGDIHISLAQKVQVSAGIVVTTPQEMALADARKGLEMFARVNIPVLGIVENMATHVCTRCGHEESIFGCGGAHRLAEEYETSVLASLPLERQIREHTDDGRPTVVQAPASRTAWLYRELAHRVAVALWRSNLTAPALPEIQIAG